MAPSEYIHGGLYLHDGCYISWQVLPQLPKKALNIKQCYKSKGRHPIPIFQVHGYQTPIHVPFSNNHHRWIVAEQCSNFESNCILCLQKADTTSLCGCKVQPVHHHHGGRQETRVGLRPGGSGHLSHDLHSNVLWVPSVSRLGDKRIWHLRNTA